MLVSPDRDITPMIARSKIIDAAKPKMAIKR
jgi:hypothetical protein